MNDTIAALSTAPFKAALGVIRVSGKDALSVVSAITDKKSITAGTSPVVFHGSIVDNGEVVDDVVITVFFAPRSYTGEDVAEISCHGSLYIINRILRLLFKNGVRQALPGEFTRRAFLNGKLDLTQAEAVIDLIDGVTGAETENAVKQLRGGLSEKINNIRRGLLDISASLLAFIDYPDDGIDDTSKKTLERELKAAYDALCVLSRSFDRGRILRDGVKTVIIGKPNVGKSKLMNRLLGEERSIVTPVAGTTRDTVTENARVGGVKLCLCDTAGVRETNDEIERLGVERTLSEISAAQLLLVVFDGSAQLDGEDEKIIAAAEVATAKKLAIFNKTDLGSANISVPYSSVRVSAVTGEGFDMLEAELSRLFGDGEFVPGEIITNARQYDCVLRASQELSHALENIKLTPDALLCDVERAVEALGSVTGQTVSEEIVANIFSRFCVGK